MIGETKIFERALRECRAKKKGLLKRYIEKKFKGVNENTGKEFLAEYIRFIAANVALVIRTKPGLGRRVQLSAGLKRIGDSKIIQKLGTISNLKPELYAMNWTSIAFNMLSKRPKQRPRQHGPKKIAKRRRK